MATGEWQLANGNWEMPSTVDWTKSVLITIQKKERSRNAVIIEQMA